MLRKYSLLSGLAVAAVLVPSSVFGAAQSPLATMMPDRPAAIEQVQWWDIDRCRAWRRECAERWGWRTERWYRCLARRGCDRWRYGDRWDR